MITFVCLMMPLVAFSQSWKENLYEKYTYRTFEKYQPANEKIDFSKIDYALLDAAIFYETNRQRAKYRKPAFRHSAGLEKSALRYSQDMVEEKFFSHSGKVIGRKTLSERIKFAGIENYSAGGENIAMTNYTSVSYIELAREFLLIWMKSPGHKRNILDENFKYLGCGCYFNSDQYAYATQIFSSDKETD